MSELHVVTGGAGFIGCHLVRTLLDNGIQVRVADNFSTGKRENLCSEAELLEGDILDTADEAVKGAQVVYHLAALPSVPRSMKDPLETFRVNVEGTARLLGAAARAGVRRVVFASSSSVYGDSPTLPRREDAQPRPLSPYAGSKLCGEAIAASWQAHTGLETVSLRFFNVFGPRQDPNSAYAAVIPIFIRCLLEGKPLPIHGDGNQKRDFTFVSDVVHGIHLAGTTPNVSGKVYNISGGRPVSIDALGRMLASMAGKPFEVDRQPPRKGDVRDSWGDTTEAWEHLGFRTRTISVEGLRMTLDWHEKRAPRTV